MIMIQHATHSFGMAFVILLSLAYLTGCGALVASPVPGILYTDVRAPVAATDNTIKDGYVSGSSTVTSILGLIATGDASIETVAMNAGITKIYYVDYSSRSVLGLYATYTVTVFGERGRPGPIERKTQEKTQEPIKREKRKNSVLDRRRRQGE